MKKLLTLALLVMTSPLLAPTGAATSNRRAEHTREENRQADHSTRTQQRLTPQQRWQREDKLFSDKLGRSPALYLAVVRALTFELEQKRPVTRMQQLVGTVSTFKPRDKKSTNVIYKRLCKLTLDALMHPKASKSFKNLFSLKALFCEFLNKYKITDGEQIRLIFKNMIIDQMNQELDPDGNFNDNMILLRAKIIAQYEPETHSWYARWFTSREQESLKKQEATRQKIIEDAQDAIPGALHALKAARIKSLETLSADDLEPDNNGDGKDNGKGISSSSDDGKGKGKGGSSSSDDGKGKGKGGSSSSDDGKGKDSSTTTTSGRGRTGRGRTGRGRRG